MQTALGANGQIAEELTRELHRNVTHDIRLVSRHPRAVHETDELVSADLRDTRATADAVAGSDVVYLTVGLPMDSAMWQEQFPVMMGNVIAVCRQHHCRLVFFDNTCMYPRTAAPQTEQTPFEPVGPKARVRAHITTMLLDQMGAGNLEALICRAPEFYGPGRTQSLTNSMVFGRIAKGRRPMVPVSAHTRRTLIWTPDASRAMALLGNTPDAYAQTWHLPCDPDRLTYRGMIAVASAAVGRRIGYTTVPTLAFRIGGLLNPTVREVEELLPRYRQDNIFDSSKFMSRFPDFPVTSYRQGIQQLVEG
ncbi:NAD-dependent epimerase/dehydratase family protein [Propionibacterium freudenreichii]